MIRSGRIRIERRQATVADRLPRDLNPVLRRVLLARGVSTAEHLDLGLSGLHRPDALGGIDRAARLIDEIIEANGRIVVVGDYDADGATGTALAVRALRALGAGQVGYQVPNRFRHGYGLTRALFEEIEPRPDLVITVDNGIASLDGVAAAREAGCRVVVTDHHLPGETLPAADAIVNPNLPDDAFPSKCLAGVGVMFYLMAALRRRRAGKGGESVNLGDLLDLVALGTVADLVPLDLNNRRLVAQGLARIRSRRACPGILALLEAADRDPSRVMATDLGYAVGPRLNAAGRLEDMGLGIELLLCEHAETARSLADQLHRINQERRELQDSMVEQAEMALSGFDADRVGDQRVIVLHDSGWHQGVVGLVASRVKDRTGRPVIAFAPESPDSPMLKGSARSIRGVHIRDLLATVEAGAPGLIDRFGGHAMAAGLSLSGERLAQFESVLSSVASRLIEDDVLHRRVRTDGPLAADELSLDTAEVLAESGPWGQGFPEPLFDGEFEVVDRRLVGQGRHLRMRVKNPDSGQELDAIAFNTTMESLEEGRFGYRLVYQLVVNEFRGRRTAELLVRYIL